MKQVNPAWAEAIGRLVNPCPYFDLQSMEIRELAWGRSRLEIELGRKHLQPFGLVHGGVFSSLVDAAGFWALYTQAPPGQGMTTVEMKLNYLAAAQEGRLVGLGRAIKLGRTLGLAETRVEDGQGNLLAHGTVTMMVLPQLGLQGDDQLPPKFLE